MAGSAPRELRIAQVLDDSQQLGAAAYMDIAAAQWLFSRLGSITRLDLLLQPGVEPRQAEQRLSALVPAGAFFRTADTMTKRASDPSRPYRVNMNALASVALFTGACLVFSTFALSGLRRRRRIGVLRALGMERGAVNRALVLEAGAFGLAGGGAGVALGTVIAALALSWRGADLGAGFFAAMAVPTLPFEAGWAGLYWALGIAAALLGAWLPSREAAQIDPAQAIRSGDHDGLLAQTPPWWQGASFYAAALLSLALPPTDGLPLGGYCALAAMLLGTLWLTPLICRIVLRALPAPASMLLRLARAQLLAAGGRASVCLVAIVASFALAVSMAILVASFRDSLETWLYRVLPADLYLRAGPAGDSAFFDAGAQARVSALAALRRAEFSRSQQLLLDPDRPPVTLLARSSNAIEQQLDLVARAESPAPNLPRAWVSEAMVDLYAARPGGVLVLPLGGRRAEFFVAGVWRDYVRQFGAVVIDRAAYAAATGDSRATEAALWLASGSDEAMVRASVHNALSTLPSAELTNSGQLRQLSMAIFDRTFALTYALEAVAVALGVAGVASTFAALVLARRKEFGVLRHLGMSRGQILLLLGTEGGMLALIGAGIGLLLGAAMSWVLIEVVNRQSFHWSMDYHLPWLGLAGYSLVTVLACAVAAVLAGRRALAGDTVAAVKEDW
jgi:putative ABC transport system permease protein